MEKSSFANRSTIQETTASALVCLVKRHSSTDGTTPPLRESKAAMIADAALGATDGGTAKIFTNGNAKREPNVQAKFMFLPR